MPARLLMNMYTTGSAHQPFNESDIKALPAGGGDPQCNTQADVEAAPTAAGIAAAGRDPPLSALGGGCRGPGPAWGRGERSSSGRAGFRGCVLGWLEGGKGGASLGGGVCVRGGVRVHPALLGLGRGAGCCPLTPREQGCDELSG